MADTPPDGVNRRLINWFMGVSTSLLLAAVLGLWSMSQEVSRMSERMETWTLTFHTVQIRVRDLEEMHREGQHPGADRRLKDLESIHRPGSPHFYNEGGGR